MRACPTCQAVTIGLFRKWLSSPSLPAYCSVCRSYSHAHRTSGGVGVVVAAFVIAASGIAASAWQALLPLLTGVAVAVSFYAWHLHRIELEPLAPAQVSLARKTEAMGGVALLIACLLN